MTVGGIEMFRTACSQLLASVRMMFGKAGQDDPMLMSLLRGIEETVPSMCDLAIAGLATREANAIKAARQEGKTSHYDGYATTLVTPTDLSRWLSENPSDLFVLIPRPLAEALTGQSPAEEGKQGGLH